MLIYANLLRLYRIWVKRLIIITITSCRRAAATICLRPPCELTISSYLFARWHLFRHVGYLRHQQQVDLWPFDLESGVRVTCNVGYLCADFSLPRPLCSRVRPDVRHRQKDRRQTKTSLNASTLWSVRRVGRHNIPLPFALVTWTAFQSCRLGGHRTSQCGSSCSTRRGNLRFVGLPVHNIIWLIFGHGIYPSDDLDLWPFDLGAGAEWSTVPRTTSLLILAFPRLFVAELWASMHHTDDMTLLPWPLTYDVKGQD